MSHTHCMLVEFNHASLWQHARTSPVMSYPFLRSEWLLQCDTLEPSLLRVNCHHQYQVFGKECFKPRATSIETERTMGLWYEAPPTAPPTCKASFSCSSGPHLHNFDPSSPSSGRRRHCFWAIDLALIWIFAIEDKRWQG